MNRWLVIFTTLLIATTNTYAQNKDRPNIVIILADDMGSGDPRCYNKDSKVPTPNMDKLASQGMRFTDSHTPSAVCTPTRYGLLTGRYCWRTKLKSGVLWGYSPLLIEQNRMTLASLLRSCGYRTGCVGKWHLGLGNDQKTDYSKKLESGPMTVGFDYFYGIPASLDMDPYVYVENDHAVQLPTLTVKGSKHRRQNGGGFWRGGPIAPGFKHIDVLPVITKKAVGFIEESAKQKSPFFLYFPLSAPHTPWLPTREFRGKSKAGYYGDFVAQVDWTVGQVLEALEQTGTADNTIVILTSDNGAHWPVADIERFQHWANLIFRGQKADIHEGGHRVPFIVRWPGRVKAKTVSLETICLTDMLATVADIMKKDLPKNVGEDSYSILPVLEGAVLKKPLREATVHHSVSGMFAIRQGDWVLIEGLGSGGFTAPRTVKPKPGGPKGQLYNLAKDISQKNNVYLDNPKIVARLSALLERYRKQGYSVSRAQE